MGNEISREVYVDKVYLALELTKTYCANTEIHKDIGDFYNIFESFLTKLLEVENLSTIVDERNKLQRENEALHHEVNTYRTETRGVFEIATEPIIDALKTFKGDMEPYVYDALMNLLTK